MTYLIALMLVLPIFFYLKSVADFIENRKPTKKFIKNFMIGHALIGLSSVVMYLLSGEVITLLVAVFFAAMLLLKKQMLSNPHFSE